MYADQTNRIEADNSDLISLVTSIRVNIDPEKQFPPQVEAESGDFHPLERHKVLPGGRDRLSQTAEGEMLERGAIVLGVVFSSCSLGAREVLVDLVKRAAELVRPESPA